MNLSDKQGSIVQESASWQLTRKILTSLGDGTTRRAFLKSVMPDALSLVSAENGGLVSQQAGHWSTEIWLGLPSAIPESLIGESIDRGTVQADSQWCVAPVECSSRGGGNRDSRRDHSLTTPVTSALVWQPTPQDQPTREHMERIAEVAEMLATALGRIQTRRRLQRRVDQQSAVLKAAAEWQRLDDDDALLCKIADTATELLHCERASIFLWDRRRRKLIGRPALGIESGSLEVDDDAGVVGEVLRTGEPKIWNATTDDETRINRDVDRSLSFETRSLLAVPMNGARGEIVGVFEVINHVDDADSDGDEMGLGTAGFDSFDAAVLTDLADHASAAIDLQRKRRSLTETRDRLVEDAASATQLIGDHQGIVDVRKSATKVAATDLTVLVLGKNGTGKEVLARHIHYESRRKSGPFIAVNCAALVESLLESELFGHEKGAFTDASETRPGKFELASGGTLFLDEVGDMSPGGQAKLLRVLEEKVVVRVGGSQTIPVDVRIIAATNQPLETLIAEKRFREDLFFRLNVVSLTLPPLAQRGDDVLLLAGHFLGIFSYQIGRKVPTLHPRTRAALLSHPWPGNIRELRNTIERVCYLCNEDLIMENDLMLGGSSTGTASTTPPLHGAHTATSDDQMLRTDAAESLSEATRRFQVDHIDHAIAACGGNMTDAAARLGLHRSNLYRKMRQLGMQTSGE